MFNAFTPWTSMWKHPRSTVRVLVQVNPRYKVFLLSYLYIFQCCLGIANFGSLGFFYPFYVILIAAALISIPFGFLWIYFMGWIFSFTGKWLGGQAPASHLRLMMAWSQLPYAFTLLMWLVLLVANAELAFVPESSGPFVLFIDLIIFISWIWSLVLLVQSLSEIQSFSILRSIINIGLVSIVYFLFYLSFTFMVGLFYA